MMCVNNVDQIKIQVLTISYISLNLSTTLNNYIHIALLNLEKMIFNRSVSLIPIETMSMRGLHIICYMLAYAFYA